MNNALKRQYEAYTRAAGCVLLLGLLALSGYAAVREEPSQTIEIPVSAKAISEWEIAQRNTEDIRAQLNREREREIALLNTVIEDQLSDESLVKQALEQKKQIADRMETEAKTLAALSYMGYEQIGVVCGAETISVFAPWTYVFSEQERVRLIDAAASQAELAPDQVKIILAKSE